MQAMVPYEANGEIDKFMQCDIDAKEASFGKQLSLKGFKTKKQIGKRCNFIRIRGYNL